VTPEEGQISQVTSHANVEGSSITFDDWLSLLERAAKWNEWLSEETAMQLVLQEYRLLLPEEKIPIILWLRLIRPWKQYFGCCHISQKSDESVAVFIGWLERVFQANLGLENV